MKNQILSLIFVISALTGFSQTLPTYKTTSNLTPIQISACGNENFQTPDTLLVPVGDSVWVGNINVWNYNWLGYDSIEKFYLFKQNLITSIGICIDTVIIGNNEDFRFKVTNTTKYRYAIVHIFPFHTTHMIFYVRGTMGLTTGIPSRDNSKAVLNAFPNPASTELTLTFNTNKHDEKIELLDIHGRIIIQNTDERELGRNTVKLDVSQLSAGIYTARIGSETIKFMKI